jgi:hypothetical protein
MGRQSTFLSTLLLLLLLRVVVLTELRLFPMATNKEN